ncbi:predicted protein [Aspergillus nidulans FGSC A4]|uniref:Uncharacterized protein n=1 Tax=Emericella nidulans (strain FGSC A4 / ATCC 38163 / CBS 112.46 / NRRL 194 / M139) TaxID=227321 RepID=Q5B8M1_EMENI|nr:predicted protein [Aspergillus nidulans FGSC A4]CBF83390.1 TPA: hypothetical protein ANIA_03109 [Aspergillus nidulans FGSC A4]|eukprot:XP_660713.1 predicted protein [Aspergillus nidulans FGSC A4]
MSRTILLRETLPAIRE